MNFSREMMEEKIQDEAFVDWICEHDGIFRFVVYQGMAAMEEDIDSLDLSVRSYNCLRRAGYQTINSVVDDIDRREDLAKIRCCGRKSANVHIASSDGRICGAKRPRCVATVQAVRKTLCRERFLT